MLNTLAAATKTPAHRYALALAIVAAALGIRLALIPWLSYKAPFLLFVLAVMVAAQVCGQGPGIAATILALFATWFFLMPAFNSFRLESTVDSFNLIVF